jgi:hypothetical protein
MMEAIRTSETSVHYEITRRYIPEGTSLHTRRRESLKSHMSLTSEVAANMPRVMNMHVYL